MFESRYRVLGMGGRACARSGVFWARFGILALVAAFYGALLALFLSGYGASQDATELLETPGMQWLAWRVALACWLFSLPPIWLLARIESRWIVRCTREPIVSLMRQCVAIRAGCTSAHLRYNGNDAALADLCDAMNELLDHFNERVSYQHQFSSDTAHELRTPLTALSVVGENALARRCTSAELREAVGSMLEESKHMKRLIETLLQLSRADSASAVVAADSQSLRDLVPLELGSLARSCVESLQALAEEKCQQLKLSASPVWADADPTLIRQALLNVIHNAIEHCPDGAHIQIMTAPFARGLAMVRVIDNGPGIPLEHQVNVFKRFYRIAGLTRRGSLGLGLAIAKAILKSQRGDIHLRSEPGSGCSFTLTLPRLCDGPSPERADVRGRGDLSQELT